MMSKAWLLLALLIGASAIAEPLPEQIIITQEAFMQLKGMFAEQAAQLSEQTGLARHWFTEYSDLKACVKDSGSHAEAVMCTGAYYAGN
jgi:hypothetical protein